MSEQNNEDKKTLVEWLTEHPRAVFLTRAFAWAVFAAGLPFAFIAWRYGIFKNQGTIAISGWGMIGIIIVGCFVLALVNYVRQGLRPGFLKQCVGGFCKIVLPLLIVLLIVQGIKDDLALFEKALGVTIVCELVAIPLNPFPEWLEKRRKELHLEEQESMFGALWDKFFSKKEENEKKESE